MKKLFALILALALILSMAACGASEPASGEEEKKQLPVTNEAPADGGEETHYKATMKAYSDIQHGKRLVILQNTLQFSREGITTAADAAVAESATYKDAAYISYAMTYATRHLIEAPAGDVTIYTTTGESKTVSADAFTAMKVLIDDFQSGNSPILLAADGTAIENFDHAVMANGEGIFSIVTEQEVNVNDLLLQYGWDNTKTYNLVATDVFYIPITPEDYDEGGLRGALSGAINASFVDMTIAMGKLNDVVFIEQIVE